MLPTQNGEAGDFAKERRLYRTDGDPKIAFFAWHIAGYGESSTGHGEADDDRL